jgi:hypothetical protein
MDYHVISDTPDPPTEVITTFPFERTWWTVKVRDQYGSTIYADPLCIDAGTLTTSVDNLTTGREYARIQDAIEDAQSSDVLVAGQGVYLENIDFKGKNLIVRSEDPNDRAVTVATVINGGGKSPTVTFSGGEDANCVLAGFTVTNGKPGIRCSGASPTIAHCTITANGGVNAGGGISLEGGSSPALTNCIIANNSASMMGGGVYNDNSSPVLTNCVFSGNSGSFGGGGICCVSGSVTLSNCILWGDSPDEMQVFAGTATVTHSDIQGGLDGEGNIDADPLFADPGSGDYRLKSQAGRWEPSSSSWVRDDVTSPCVDAGDPGSDWTAELWPHGKRINMGACGGTPQASMSLSEVGNAADCNNDGSVDARDLLILSASWLAQEPLLAEDINRDGSVDNSDFADFAALVSDWLY